MAEVNIGTDYAIKIFSITNGADTLVAFQKPVSSFIMREVTGAIGFQIRRNSGDTDYYPVLAGEFVSANIKRGARGGVPTAATYTVGYIRSGGANCDVSVMYSFG